VKTDNDGATWILPALDVVASLVALSALLPMAGGMPAIASQGQPLADGAWFTIVLGGALLLLAGGLKLLLRQARLHLFVFLYACLNRHFGCLTIATSGL
jgi:hypothetical protein